MWTRFMDMCSGGGLKEKWDYIYIEAEEDVATRVFYSRFAHHPQRISCSCCGSDYSVNAHKSLAQLTAYERYCDWSPEKNRYIEQGFGRWGKYVTLEEYKKSPNVLFIHKCDISVEDRRCVLPEEEGV